MRETSFDMQVLAETDRERLLRRWVTLVVERSSLEELAVRPLGERLRDLDLLLEVAREEPGLGSTLEGGRGLRDELAGHLEHHLRTGEPFSVALLAIGESAHPPSSSAAPAEEVEQGAVSTPVVRRFRRGDPSEGRAGYAPGWARALEEAAAEGQLVLPAAEGRMAVVLPQAGRESARLAVDRLRVSAWRLLAGEGRLAEAGLATCPDDGLTAHELLAAAQERLEHSTDPGVEQARDETHAPEASRPEASPSAPGALKVLPLR